MSFSIRPIFVAICLLAEISVCYGQSVASSTLQPVHDDSSTGYSSSRTGLDSALNPATASPTLSAVAANPSAVGGGVTSQRPAYSATDRWLFTQKSVGAFVSPLGLGIGAATTISRSLNLRAAGSFFGYSLSGINSGVTYEGSLSFQSMQTSVDWFPWHRSFHISPGVLFYNQNHITVHGGVAPGESFTVNGANYYSGAPDPVTLYGSVTFRRTSPMLTAGWGNWLPRGREKHFSFPFEVGFAYVGDAPLTLTFTGVVCDTPAQLNCRSIDSDPTVQQNIDAQRKKYQNDLDYIRFYPILSTGVAYKF
jgi:hypothetical protein